MAGDDGWGGGRSGLSEARGRAPRVQPMRVRIIQGHEEAGEVTKWTLGSATGGTFQGVSPRKPAGRSRGAPGKLGACVPKPFPGQAEEGRRWVELGHVGLGVGS